MLWLYFYLTGEKMNQNTLKTLLTATGAGIFGYYLYDRKQDLPVDAKSLLLRGGTIGGVYTLATLLYQRSQRPKPIVLEEFAVEVPQLPVAETVDQQIELDAMKDEDIRLEISRVRAKLHEAELMCQDISIPMAQREEACAQIITLSERLRAMEDLLIPAVVIAGGQV